MLLLEQFENLTLHPKNAARLKALVLQLAVQGKLTENWRRKNPAVEPAAALLKRIEVEKAQLVKEKKIKKENPLEPVLENEVPYTLPDGWAWCKFQNIQVEAQAGLERSKNLQSKSYTYGYLKMNNIGLDGRTDLSNFVRVEANEEEVKKYELRRGDFLFNSRNSKELVGKTTVFLDTIESTPILYNNNIIRVRLANDIDPKFINYWFASPPAYLLKQSLVTATTNVAALYQGQLMSFFVPLPPLAEQEAIVARVEELMQKIEELEKQTAASIKLKQHLGAAALQRLTSAADEELEQNWLFLKQHFQSMFDEEANVKKLRETILQLAVQGKLTATWRKYNPTTEPASDLLKRIQAEKTQLVKDKKIKKEKSLEPISADEVPYTLPEGWAWCRMGDLCKLITDGTHHTPKYVDSGVPFLSVKDMSSGSLSFESTRFISEKEHKELIKRCHPEFGDILLTKIGTTGVAVNINTYKEFSIFVSVALLKINPSMLNGQFLKHLINSPLVKIQSEEGTEGVGNKNLVLRKIKSFLVPLPPLAEQEAIVAKVDQLMQLCDALEQQIQQSKKETEALMQAVVQEALQVQAEVS